MSAQNKDNTNKIDPSCIDERIKEKMKDLPFKVKQSPPSPTEQQAVKFCDKPQIYRYPSPLQSKPKSPLLMKNSLTRQSPTSTRTIQQPIQQKKISSPQTNLIQKIVSSQSSKKAKANSGRTLQVKKLLSPKPKRKRGRPPTDLYKISNANKQIPPIVISKKSLDLNEIAHQLDDLQTNSVNENSKTSVLRKRDQKELRKNQLRRKRGDGYDTALLNYFKESDQGFNRSLPKGEELTAFIEANKQAIGERTADQVHDALRMVVRQHTTRGKKKEFTKALSRLQQAEQPNIPENPSGENKNESFDITQSVIQKLAPYPLEQTFCQNLFEALPQQEGQFVGLAKFKYEQLEAEVKKYVDDVLFNEEGKSENDFSHLLPKTKLYSWFEDLNYQQINEENLLRVGNEVDSLLKKVSYEEAQTIPISPQTCAFLRKLLLHPKFFNITDVSGAFLCVLHAAGMIREVYLSLLVECVQIKKKDKSRLNYDEKKKLQIQSCLYKLYKEQLHFDPKVVSLILKKPKKLLFDNLLTNLKDFPGVKNQLITLADRLLSEDSEQNPSQQIILCANFGKSCPGIVNQVVDKLVLEGSIEEFYDFLRFLHERPREMNLIQESMKSNKIKDWIQVMENSVKSRQEVSLDARQQNNLMADQMAREADVYNDYEKLCQQSRIWAQSSNGMYTHCSMLCFYSILTLKTKKKVKMVQLDCGNGKSFLILLVALYLTKFSNKKVVIATLNNILLSQLEQKAHYLKLTNTTFCLSKQLHSHVDTDSVLLIDEYSWTITYSKIELNALNQIPAIYTAGTKRADLIGFCGVVTKRFQDFIYSRFPENQFIEIGKIIKDSTSKGQILFQVECEPSKLECKRRLIREAQKNADENKITFCFGIKDLEGATDLVREPANYYFVKDEQALQTVLTWPAETDNGILFLDQQFAVGVDLKFTKGAQVFVMGPCDIPKERLFQMFARGSRALNTTFCKLFTVGNKNAGTLIKLSIESQNGTHFREGARNLKFIEERLQHSQMRRPLSSFIQKLGPNPWRFFTEVLDQMTAKEQKTLLPQSGKNANLSK